MLEIKTYKELKDYIKAFSKKKINFLTIVSRGGLGKSYLSEEILAENAPLFLNGHLTPLAFHKILYNENQTDSSFILVLDDLDGLLHNETNIAILKAVCDTKDKKLIKYTSTTRLISEQEKEFTTRCKTLLLTNSLNVCNNDLSALVSRANVVNFNPPDIEILKFLKTFAKDSEIIKYIEKYAKFSKNLNLRVYARAVELKNSNLNWKQEVINSMEINPKYEEYFILKEKYKTENERAEHYSQSRASYFRIKKELEAKILQTQK